MTSTYCFKCRTCGAVWEGDMFAGKHCNAPDVIRDYRGKSVV